MSNNAPRRKQAHRASVRPQCPVSDPSIGIISENDHRVGLCLCRFCTCSQHSCPSVKAPDPFLSCAFLTKYQQEFPAKQFDSPLKYEPKKFYRTPQKFEGTTTNSSHYIAHTIRPYKEETRAKPAVNRELLARSSYSSDFPNWGPTRVSYEKQ